MPLWLVTLKALMTRPACVADAGLCHSACNIAGRMTLAGVGDVVLAPMQGEGRGVRLEVIPFDAAEVRVALPDLHERAAPLRAGPGELAGVLQEGCGVGDAVARCWR
ncbi:hypothetical protein [Bradyrhizobium elkanii]|nr:hypothetical protein [Bradyrhizobium elkanii]